jgi:SAM-dependent methyltransferase
MSTPETDWVSFWDGAPSIYVNARHLDVHYRDIADGIVSLLPGPHAHVLDYGCGEATHAAHVAQVTAQVSLCEAAATVRANIAQRFSSNAKVKVLSPDDVERLPASSFDLIIANSIVQYLSAAELERLLALWRRLLAPDGVLVVGDIIPPNVSPMSDAVALLRYAAKHNFVHAAILGLLRTIFSPYRKVRAQLGIACYTEAEFLSRLTEAGYRGERLAYNLEHNPARMTFRAQPLRPSVLDAA